MSEKLNYLNVGCGKKYHKKWFNIDMVPATSDVTRANLIKGIPFDDNQFEVVYHSQVLEHIPKEDALKFIKECFRILKDGGILRVVVPDLENIISEYLKSLNKLNSDPDEHTEANYDWIMLELFDQVVRTDSGGLMSKYLEQKHLINEKYVIERIGFVGHHAREKSLSGEKQSAVETIKRKLDELGAIALFKELFRLIKNKILNTLLGKKYRIGNFRMGGEIHQWMYDKYSLTRLLKNAGFHDIKVRNAFESDIPDWDKYELDVKDGMVYDPTSLFIEAKK